MNDRKVWLERGNGVHSIHFNPPLSQAELEMVPLPRSREDASEVVQPSITGRTKLGHITVLGFASSTIEQGFSNYAIEAGEKLGTTNVDPLVRPEDSRFVGLF